MGELNPLRILREKLSHIYLDTLGYASGKEYTDAFIQRATSGTVFLDAGCGEGKIRKLLPDGVHYIGVDVFQGESAVGYAGWEHKPDVLADLHQLPLKDSSCDVVILLHVLEHVQSPQKVLNELARVMKAGATLVIAVPFVHQLHHVPHDYYRFSKYALQDLLDHTGLRVQSIRPSGGYFRCLENVLSYFTVIFKSSSLIAKLVLAPLWVWIIALNRVVRIFEYPLDMLGGAQEFTAGYLCLALKAEDR